MYIYIYIYIYIYVHCLCSHISFSCSHHKPQAVECRLERHHLVMMLAVHEQVALMSSF